MVFYHVVTDRPMEVGQKIVFDENNRSGVCRRVMEKLPAVEAIYANPDDYDAETLEHHTSVALRELALEEVRLAEYPELPSRLGCLYASKTLAEAEEWGKFFARIGRPTYSIVKLEVKGSCFVGDATRCFRGLTHKEENLRLARRYWASEADPADPTAVPELLISGELTVLEIVREINANI